MTDQFNKRLEGSYDKQKFQKLCEIYVYDIIKKEWHTFQKKYDLKCRWQDKDFIPLMFCKTSFLKKVYPKINFKDGGSINKIATKVMKDCFILRNETIQINQDYKSVNQKTDLVHIVYIVMFLSEFGKRHSINKCTKENISLDKFSDSVIENLNSGDLQNKSETDKDEYNDEDIDEAENELNEADHLTQLTDSDIEALSKKHDDDYVNDRIKVI